MLSRHVNFFQRKNSLRGRKIFPPDDTSEGNHANFADHCRGKHISSLEHRNEAVFWCWDYGNGFIMTRLPGSSPTDSVVMSGYSARRR